MDIYSKIIHEDDFEQIRITISEFHDVEYLHVRKYYITLDGDWLPSKDGISMPIDFTNIREFLTAMLEIVSLAESKEIIEQNFKDILEVIYQ